MVHKLLMWVVNKVYSKIERGFKCGRYFYISNTGMMFRPSVGDTMSIGKYYGTCIFSGKQIITLEITGKVKGYKHDKNSPIIIESYGRKL